MYKNPAVIVVLNREVLFIYLNHYHGINKDFFSISVWQNRKKESKYVKKIKLLSPCYLSMCKKIKIV